MQSNAPRRRARLSPLTVIGELLLMSGLIVAGYIVWQPWYTTTVVAGEQQKISAATVAQWESAAASPDGRVPVAARPAEGEDFGVVYVPAFAPGFANVLAEGTDRETVLHLREKGIGHYTSTQMPGEPGNVAIAAHRSGPRTTPFKEIMNLRLDDPIFVRTQEGWYTYRFRSIEYVLPEEVDVLKPFPRLADAAGSDQILTLTTCHPKDFGADERAIAYAVFDSFQPNGEGPPEALLAANPNFTEV